MELKTFNRNVKTIAAAGKKLDLLVHLTACGGLLLVQQDGNATRMDQLLLALPKGYRQQAFKLWVQAHSPIRWNGDGKIGVQKPNAKAFTAFNIPAAEAVPFWDFSKENDVKSFSIETLMAMLKRESDKLAKADENGDIRDAEGKITHHVDGNIVDFRAKVEAARAAIAGAKAA